MKQSTFKAKLNQYYRDVDRYFDLLVQSHVRLAFLDRDYTDVMKAIGVKDSKHYTDIMLDIIATEEDARKEGREPVRKVYYYTEYEEPEEGVPPVQYKNRTVKREVWLDYTEEDYQSLVLYREEFWSAIGVPGKMHIEAQEIINDLFLENADLITAECLTILHTVTKADCEDFLRRTREYIKVYSKEINADADAERDVLNGLTKSDKASVICANFLQKVATPFELAVQEIRQAEFRGIKDRNAKDFVDYVFADIGRINAETMSIVTPLYGRPFDEDGGANDIYLRQTKLARTKEINALQTLNLARDSKGVQHQTTRSGGLTPVNVFENKGVEVLTPRIEDVSLSTNTRQLLDYYFFKGIEQIPHKGSIERLYRQRAVTVDLDELATVFSIDKKEARKRLNSFYDEVRDLKIKLHYYVKEGKRSEKYIATVNIFDADLQKIDQEEKNATARPEDLDDGVQISFFNTGTLLNYNPKRKKEPKNAVQRGRLTMQFSMDFARHLSQASVVRHNPKGYLIDRRKYKSAYSVQTTLEDHAYMNRDKRNAGIISLNTLLKDCYEIPTYDAVLNGNRNVTGRIKKPLIATVQALKEADVLRDFHYCDPMKRTLTEAELLSLDYDDFINCTLHFELAPIEE